MRRHNGRQNRVNASVEWLKCVLGPLPSSRVVTAGLQRRRSTAVVAVGVAGRARCSTTPPGWETLKESTDASLPKGSRMRPSAIMTPSLRARAIAHRGTVPVATGPPGYCRLYFAP